MYNPPTFNRLVEFWVPPNLPSLGAPTGAGLAVQIYVPSRMEGIEQYEIPGPFQQYTPPIIFRMASGAMPPQRGIVFNAGPGSVDYYLSVYWQEMHIGFPNQYLAVLCYQCNANGSSPRTY